MGNTLYEGERMAKEDYKTKYEECKKNMWGGWIIALSMFLFLIFILITTPESDDIGEFICEELDYELERATIHSIFGEVVGFEIICKKKAPEPIVPTIKYKNITDGLIKVQESTS